MTRARFTPTITVERRGLRCYWEVWWRTPAGAGPTRRGRTWTRRSATRHAEHAQADGWRRPGRWAT